MKTPLILATGFSVFPSAPVNPTAWAMAELERAKWQPVGARLVTRTLPVRFDLWEAELEAAISVAKPDAVVAFGLSAKATGVTLEAVARNVVACDRADHSGARAASPCVVEGGAATLPSRLALDVIAQRLRAAGIPVDHSSDAGDYLCNLLFYRLMVLAHAGELKTAGFVHVPYLDTQVARLVAEGHHVPHASTLREEQLIEAVKIVITASAEALLQSTRSVA